MNTSPYDSIPDVLVGSYDLNVFADQIEIMRLDREVREALYNEKYYFDPISMFQNEPCEENTAPNAQRHLDVYNCLYQLTYIKDKNGKLHKYYRTDKIEGFSVFMGCKNVLKRFISEMSEQYINLNK